MSHTSLDQAQRDPQALTWIEDTHLLAVPEQDWEQIKIGGGAPPVRTHFGWLLVYHGVAGAYVEGAYAQLQLQYAAGLMVLDVASGRHICYRTRAPLLTPELLAEREGTVPNVVFPTGLDQRPDAADPEGFDLYYGMADTRIGAARLRLPPALPTEES
jgi:predicted GH43/DUF377 family glycosyl hydrolase